MIKVNTNFAQLPENYLFAEIAHKVSEYKAVHPDKKIISLGIGDVTRPIVPEVIKAMHKAVDDEADLHFMVMARNRVMDSCVKP